MQIHPMDLMPATNYVSLALVFAGAGSTNSRGYYPYAGDALQGKNWCRHAKHSARASLAVLLRYFRALHNERYRTLIDKVRLGITPVADDGGRHGD
jgi:hypothetical protein